ncbi:MAG: polysaccharide deacetylase family protein [Anaerolineae bacterium]|nr:polysaccharide deacetylase family protein [Anaerolineae bacterium]
MKNPIAVALRGKGVLKLAQRAFDIVANYGVTPTKLDAALKQFVAILDRYNSRATFPIVSVVLQRNPEIVRKYYEQGIEFAIHGYRHIDHWEVPQKEQLDQLKKATEIFNRAGIPVQGFRGPYLHANKDTLDTLRELGLSYDSSPSLGWNVLNGNNTEAYQYVQNFYGTQPADLYPSVPAIVDGIVQIPYSLPDDEALVQRLALNTTSRMNTLWLAVLQQSYGLGELFTLGLHPERALICREPLSAVLERARQLYPTVWIATLAEITSWWKARTAATIDLARLENNTLYQIAVNGPPGTTMLVRNVEVQETATQPWFSNYQRVETQTLKVKTPVAPWLCYTDATAPELVSFLQQQGYILERKQDIAQCAFSLTQENFTPEDKRPVLNQIENADFPLVRLGRWPDGARSALSITGDIDCLTIWDYGLRFLGK